jgi:hypothetical protein
MSENRVLRRIFKRRKEEVAGGWRRLHNEELHNLYASSNTIRVVKSRREKWERHVTGIEEMRKCIQKFGLKTCREETTRKT